MLLYAFPTFAALFSSWLYREKVTGTAWLCVAAVLTGVALLVDPAGGGDLDRGTLAGIVSAVFAGLTIAIIRRLKQSNGSVVIYLYFCVVGTLTTLPGFLHSPTFPADLTQLLVCGGIVVTSILGPADDEPRVRVLPQLGGRSLPHERGGPDRLAGGSCSSATRSGGGSSRGGADSGQRPAAPARTGPERPAVAGRD